MTRLIVNPYWNSFLIEGFLVFLTVLEKVLKNMHSLQQYVNALQNNLHMEPTCWCVASLEERIERIWFSKWLKACINNCITVFSGVLVEPVYKSNLVFERKKWDSPYLWSVNRL